MKEIKTYCEAWTGIIGLRSQRNETFAPANFVIGCPSLASTITSVPDTSAYRMVSPC